MDFDPPEKFARGSTRGSTRGNTRTDAREQEDTRADAQDRPDGLDDIDIPDVDFWHEADQAVALINVCC
jgi:hypothetical protein